jgi:hypothetical protein
VIRHAKRPRKPVGSTSIAALAGTAPVETRGPARGKPHQSVDFYSTAGGSAREIFALTALGRAKLGAAAAEWRAERGDAPRAGCDCCECREVRA